MSPRPPAQSAPRQGAAGTARNLPQAAAGTPGVLRRPGAAARSARQAPRNPSAPQAPTGNRAVRFAQGRQHPGHRPDPRRVQPQRDCLRTSGEPIAGAQGVLRGPWPAARAPSRAGAAGSSRRFPYLRGIRAGASPAAPSGRRNRPLRQPGSSSHPNPKPASTWQRAYRFPRAFPPIPPRLAGSQFRALHPRSSARRMPTCRPSRHRGTATTRHPNQPPPAPPAARSIRQPTDRPLPCPGAPGAPCPPTNHLRALTCPAAPDAPRHAPAGLQLNKCAAVRYSLPGCVVHRPVTPGPPCPRARRAAPATHILLRRRRQVFHSPRSTHDRQPPRRGARLPLPSPSEFAAIAVFA